MSVRSLATDDAAKPETAVMIVAGEASGDKHGAALARALVQNNPFINFRFFGSGGDEMRSAGVQTLVDAREVAIIGVPEVLGALGKLYGAYRKLIRAAHQRAPNVVVLIDWPDFNLRLARRLKRDGFKIVYYISPQVWAWRRYRVGAIRRYVDRMLVILPFEEEFYRGHGVEVTYVGHPLVDCVRTTCSRAEFARRHGLDPARPIVSLLPGSRRKELYYHLPHMIDAATRLSGMGKETMAAAGSTAGPPQFVVPLASTVERREVEQLLEEGSLKHSSSDKSADSATEPLTNQSAITATSAIKLLILEGETYDAVGNSDIAVVASGTATVEAALLGTPMVIVYRGSEINWRLIRPLIKLDTFGMVNLIAGRRIITELIQHDVSGERIAREVNRILLDPQRQATMKRDLARVRELLQTDSPGAKRAAGEVMAEINEAVHVS